MDSDWLFIGAVMVILLYMAGYVNYAVFAGLLIVALLVMSVVFQRQPKGSGSSSGVLEPIVIESTRGLQYRIPGTLEIKYDRKASEGAQWEKTEKKWGKAVGRFIGAARGDKPKED